MTIVDGTLDCTLIIRDNKRMNVRTNLLLPEDVVADVDHFAGPRGRTKGAVARSAPRTDTGVRVMTVVATTKSAHTTGTPRVFFKQCMKRDSFRAAISILP